MKYLFLFLTSLLFFNAVVFGQSRTIYVDANATGLNNGSSWTNAYKSLDSALLPSQNLSSSDTIKIAQGIYKPVLMPGGISSTDPRDVAFYMPKEATVLGGYATGGGVRNPWLYKTVLTGEIGNPNDISDNTYHVALFIESNAFIEGLFFQAGNANGIDSVTINNKKLARFNGGGAYFLDSDIEGKGLVFLQNESNGGGGCVLKTSQLVFENCFFLNNTAYGDGGAILKDTSDLNLANTVFYSNRSEYNGGAIYNNGPGFFNMSHSTLLKNGIFFGMGGAVYNKSNTSAQVSNTLFSLNYKGFNSISFPGNDIYDSIGVFNVRHSLVQSYAAGIDCVLDDSAYVINDADPDGVDDVLATTDDGMRITPASLAFNRGTYPSKDFDITGTPRNLFSFFDIGAYLLD